MRSTEQIESIWFDQCEHMDMFILRSMAKETLNENWDWTKTPSDVYNRLWFMKKLDNFIDQHYPEDVWL